MLYPMRFMNVRDVLKYPQRALVVWNTDPLQLGRIKVIIPGLLEGKIADLPWFSRWNAPTEGGSKERGVARPPAVDSEVMVEFFYEDIYHGFYTGVMDTVSTASNPNRSAYPAQETKADAFGNIESTNVLTGEKRIVHQSGSSITFLGNGDIVIEAKKSLTLRNQEGTDLKLSAETRSIQTTESGTTSGGGEAPSVNAKEYSLDVKNYTLASEGGYEANVLGGYKTKVGGSYSQSVLGNFGQVVAGQSSYLFAQIVNETYALGKTTTVVSGAWTFNQLVGTYTVNLAAGAVSFSGATVALTGLSAVNIVAPLVTLGAGIAPAISLISDPIEDFITAKPKLGVATILIG